MTWIDLIVVIAASLLAGGVGAVIACLIYDQFIGPFIWRRRAVRRVKDTFGPLRVETKPHPRTIRKH